jgi:pyridoxamine 5'-phosphate oxidase
MKIQDLRQEYKGRALLEEDCPADPFALFRIWFKEAMEEQGGDFNAMVLSTADTQSRPSGRVVLLKDLDSGFVWFTNYDSRKGADLSHNPAASLTFWWEVFSRQVRVGGMVRKVDSTESDSYFHSRPLGSRAGAIASSQSTVIKGRTDLDRRYQELMMRPESELKRPENWGGFRLIPDYFEFWQGRESRLHDRIQYRLEDGKWMLSRLSP